MSSTGALPSEAVTVATSVAVSPGTVELTPGTTVREVLMGGLAVKARADATSGWFEVLVKSKFWWTVTLGVIRSSSCSSLGRKFGLRLGLVWLVEEPFPEGGEHGGAPYTRDVRPGSRIAQVCPIG